MSILDQKLSAMQVGTPVRFTQANGQIIEGIISENDKSDTLTVQVSTTFTLKYSQIACIEENNAFGAILPQKVTSSVITESIKQNENKKKEIIISCSKEDIKAAFKNMDSEMRNIFSPVLSKIQNAIKSHESEKINEAVDLSWKLIEQNHFEEDPKVNAFYANACVLNKDFHDAAISFYYSNDIENAYRSAYYGAENENNIELYSLAAVFASMYIVNENNESINEVMEVLMISSEKCKDITGLKYIISHDISDTIKNALIKAFNYLGKSCGHILSDFSDLDQCIKKLLPYYAETQIINDIMGYESNEEDNNTNNKSGSSSPPAPKEWYNGTVTSYNPFEEKGKIEDSDGSEFYYELNDIKDIPLKNQLKKTLSKKNFKPISNIEFKVTRKMGRDYAINIKRIIKTMPAPVQSKVDANALFMQGEYEEAVELYKKQLDTPDWEEAFSQLIMCYLSLWNKNGDHGYSHELKEITEKYADKVSKTTKNLESLQHYYMKIHDYSKCLNTINSLIESCESEDYNRILHYLIGKERCYRNLHDYPSAIGQLQDWLDIVKRYKITNRYDMRNSMIYIELAELYFEIKDYENAEKYALNSSCSEERKQSLLDKIKSLNKSEDENYDDPTDEDIEDDTTAITLQEAYDAYSDEDGIEKLGINDTDIIKKISAFDEKNLYCLLAWLSAISLISKKSNSKQISTLNSELNMDQSIQSIESAFSYAYHNPLAECEYTSTQIINTFETSKKLIPEYCDGLMTSAVLRTLFNPSNIQDYYLDDLILVVERSDISDKYPMLINLLTTVKSFYDNTGCAIDAFAGYRSNVNIIDNIINEAKELCKTIDKRNDIFESQGQVRRMREMIFTDENSELRKCLNIVAENNVDKFKYVSKCMEEMFIRNNRPLTIENTDIKKIDAYIDLYWDKARDIIVSEGRHVARPHDKIKGSKRNNIISTIKKIISCLCDWVAVAEHSANHEERYIKENYEAVAPQIITMLEELYSASCKAIKENGFDWGTNSICSVSKELLSKMNGTYNTKDKKYFFINFLLGEDVLLNEDYLPELQSTFCNWNKMNILSRIERHAAEPHISLEKRVSEIFSDSEIKHNFRTARLIKLYAEDTGNTNLANLKDFEQMNACLKQAKQRFESMYQDFSNEIELFESYGTISNINGEKSDILKLALDWYKITRITNDFGFYAKMLDSIKNHISLNAAERGQNLMRQLEDLADKPEYDFGVYSKEMIASLIDDQNYTSAEFMLNCIRRHDTKEVHNYTVEPFGYFSEFVNEHATNYRAVFGAGKNVVDTILTYSGKKDLEKALIYLTTNARKETKGGAELLKSWPKGSPVNQDDLQKLLIKLGFDPISIKPDENSNVESYKVFCRKRSGKVTYPHTIPAFGSLTETEGFRVACLYGKFDCNSLMNRFRMMNATAKHTLVILDYALNMEERRRLARKIKEEKSFSKTFIVIDRVILFYLAKHYSADTIAKRFMATTLPFAYYQPFVEASTQTMPAELFTGREAELTSIESPDGVNLVYGGRQLGKSALLKMAQHNIDKNGNNDRAVLLDIQYKNYKEAAKLLSQELITREILDESCECDNWDDLARHIKKRLMDENPETRINYLLIMLDEADEFIKTSAEDDNPPIAAVKNLPAGRFKLVMAGLHNLSRFNREMLQGNSNLIHLSSVVIKQFQRPEAIKLLTNTLAYLGFRFDEKVISLILAKTNYYPGLIQFYCQKLLEAMKNDDYAGYSETNTPYYNVNEGHIKKVLSDNDFMSKVNEKLEASLFTEEKGHSHYHIIALIFAYLYYDSPTEKKYTIDDLLRVAEEYKITRLITLDREKIDELLNEMWDLNVLSKEDNYYRFATEGFRELLGSREQIEDGISKYFEGDKK